MQNDMLGYLQVLFLAQFSNDEKNHSTNRSKQPVCAITSSFMHTNKHVKYTCTYFQRQ